MKESRLKKEFNPKGDTPQRNDQKDSARKGSYIRLKSPPTKDLAVATKQLSSMIRTGLPLLEALKIISDTTEHPTLQFVFRETAIGISKGSTMVDNLEKYPQVFNEMYLALVSAGETAGLLPDTLDRQAKLLES